ncbi:MAG TPA: serine/threonine-protein kinase, partial [Polyangiaceae bacterium]|nr:serine/threonine-protein kinase [Polyangiaceae bacterium]
MGAFRLGDRLGLGGMAEVFAGEHDRLGRVAVKRILPGLAEDPEFSDMFWDEARITSRLDHPNIVRVLDYGRTDGQLYMALEFVDGPALSKVLRKAAKMKHPLSYPALLTVMAQVLDALHYVHNATDERERPLHIVHRDVSPGNIMLTKSGQAKLGDFG